MVHPDEPEFTFYVAVDAVVFTVIKGRLHVLLIKNKFPPYQDHFALPGGRAQNTEELEHAVSRKLQEETGVGNIFLKPFHAYSAVHRDPRNRVLSVAFLAFIDSERFTLEANSNALTAHWVAVDEVRELAYDHKQILADALRELRYDIQTTNIAAQLLPEKFTLTELEELYEHVLDRELDKRNFRKKIEELGILEKTRETKMEGAHRPAALYKFKTREFQPLAEKMHVLL
jgi:8-oxo-dGTP diphosphatase